MVATSWPRAWCRAVPSICRPAISTPPTSHRFECPVAQDGHLPQAGTKPSTTWSPGARPRHARADLLDDAGALVAADDRAAGTGMSPVTRCSSEWHMPEAASGRAPHPPWAGRARSARRSSRCDAPTRWRLRSPWCLPRCARAMRAPYATGPRVPVPFGGRVVHGSARVLRSAAVSTAGGRTAPIRPGTPLGDDQRSGRTPARSCDTGGMSSSTRRAVAVDDVVVTQALRPARGLVNESHKWVALFISTLGMLMATIDGSIAHRPARHLPGHRSRPAPGRNSFFLLWMILGFLVVTSVLVASLGRMGDIYGRVRIYNLGFAVFTFFSLLLSVTWMTGPPPASGSSSCGSSRASAPPC